MIGVGFDIDSAGGVQPDAGEVIGVGDLPGESGFQFERLGAVWSGDDAKEATGLIEQEEMIVRCSQKMHFAGPDGGGGEGPGDGGSVRAARRWPCG